jgi:hypothetical protein
MKKEQAAARTKAPSPIPSINSSRVKAESLCFVPGKYGYVFMGGTTF